MNLHLAMSWWKEITFIHSSIHAFIHSFIIHLFLSPCVPDGPVAWLPRHFRTADLTGSLKVPRLRRWSGGIDGIDQCVWFQLCHSWKWQQRNHQTRIKQFKVRTNLLDSFSHSLALRTSEPSVKQIRFGLRDVECNLRRRHSSDFEYAWVLYTAGEIICSCS